ncbi:MAG: hypothetical protein HRT38_10945 [Alteromonadaceae bacterium]|nr:hypothetical protein [Alteromonadaceae bacterium]
MSDIGIWQILVVIAIILLNILPCLLVFLSKKVEGPYKFLWFSSAFFASWVGYFAFYYIVVKNIKTLSARKPVLLNRDENGRLIKSRANNAN